MTREKGLFFFVQLEGKSGPTYCGEPRRPQRPVIIGDVGNPRGDHPQHRILSEGWGVARKESVSVPMIMMA